MIKSYVYPLQGNIILMKGIFLFCFFKLEKKNFANKNLLCFKFPLLIAFKSFQCSKTTKVHSFFYCTLSPKVTELSIN